MHFGIIAAGEGSRLRADGILLPKPLVTLGDESMIDRLLRIFIDNGATSVSIIINEEMRELMDYWDNRDYSIPFQLITKSTLGSFDSLCSLCPTILSCPFCITTVDTIFDEVEFAEYVRCLKTTTSSGLFPVTDYVDDDSPLYIKGDLDWNIVEISDQKCDESVRYVSGGIYGFTRDISKYIHIAQQKGINRKRDFQMFLIESGLDIRMYPMKKIFDVDRKSDWEKANNFILHEFNPIES